MRRITWCYSTVAAQRRSSSSLAPALQLYVHLGAFIPSRFLITDGFRCADENPTSVQKAKPRSGTPLIVYGRPEDEFFHKRAAWSASFPVADRPVAKDELRQLRLVMLIESDQVRRHHARPGQDRLLQCS